MTCICTRSGASHRSLQESFLAVVPQIRAYAKRVFQNRLPQERQELVAETVAWAWKLFVACAVRDRDPNEKLISLLRYSALAVKSGRRLGRPLNSTELFDVARKADSSIRLVPLPQNGRCAGTPSFVNEMLVDRKAFSPAAAAAARIDFATWLRGLSTRNRRIARALASGERTSAVARTFCVSSARIAQLRREFQRSWERFQGDAPETEYQGFELCLAVP